MVLKRLAVLASMALLQGCSTLIEGVTTTIAFYSNPTGAQCHLTRKGEKLGTVTTPGGIAVQKAKYGIRVQCQADGREDAVFFLGSGLSDTALLNLGGAGNLPVLGWGIDSALGADNVYPKTVTIYLPPARTNPGTQP